MLEELIGASIGIAMASYVGYNFFGINDSIAKNLIEEPSRRLLYEEEFRDNKRKNIQGFLLYYFGYLGRCLAYKEFDKIYKLGGTKRQKDL